MKNYVNKMLNNDVNRPRLGLGLGPRDRTYRRGYNAPSLSSVGPAQIKTFIEELLRKIDDVEQAQGKIDIVLKNGTKHTISLNYK